MRIDKIVFIVSGEASGDVYAGKLVKSINEISTNMVFYGIGGDAMRKSGVKILVDLKELSVMGISEVLIKIPILFFYIRKIKHFFKKNKPNLLVLIDYPDFNFILGSIAKKLGIPILYYVSPQIWAWRNGRIKKIKKFVDHMAVILPFEKVLYNRVKVASTFVGHPLLDYVKPISNLSDSSFENKIIKIALLPGSRKSEIKKLLPLMLKSANLIKKNIIDVEFIVSCSNSVSIDEFYKILKKHNNGLNFKISHRPVSEILKTCNLSIAVSGTVTLESALNNVPTVVIYCSSFFTYMIAKCMVNVKYISLVNLLMDREIFPELIQNMATENNITKYVISLLGDEEKLKIMKKDFLLIKKRLGEAGVSNRVAKLGFNMLKKNNFKLL